MVGNLTSFVRRFITARSIPLSVCYCNRPTNIYFHRLLFLFLLDIENKFEKDLFLHIDCLLYYLHLYGFLELPPANKHTTFPTHTGCVDLLIVLTHTQLALSSDSHLIFCTYIMHTRWTPQVASGSYHSCAITYDDVGQYCSKVTGTIIGTKYNITCFSSCYIGKYCSKVSGTIRTTL